MTVEWDFDGRGMWPEHSELHATNSPARLATRHSYDAPGVYYPAVRVTSSPDGDAAGRGLVGNLARTCVRVA